MSYGEYLGAGSATTKLLLHLNGNSTDSSGNNNNGVDTAITYSQANGMFGMGAGFNGSSSVVYLGDPDSLSPARPMTIVSWFKTSNAGTQTDGYTIARKRAGGWLLQMANSDTGSGAPGLSAGQLSLSIWTGASYVNAKTTATFNDNNWHCVVGVIDTSSLNIYVDGKLHQSTSNSSAINYGAGGVAVGRAGDYAGAYWNGLIDEVIIENIAWTPQQVAKYYANSRGFYATL